MLSSKIDELLVDKWKGEKNSSKRSFENRQSELEGEPERTRERDDNNGRINGKLK